MARTTTLARAESVSSRAFEHRRHTTASLRLGPCDGDEYSRLLSDDQRAEPVPRQ